MLVARTFAAWEMKEQTHTNAHTLAYSQKRGKKDLPVYLKKICYSS